MADRDLSLTPDEEKPRSLDSQQEKHSHINQLHLATRSVVSTEGVINADELNQVLDEAAIEAAGQGEGNSAYLWGLTFFATIGGLLFGYDC